MTRDQFFCEIAILRNPQSETVAINNPKRSFTMGRKAADDGGRATIEKLYPEANELRKKRLTEKLKTYSSNKVLFNKEGKKKVPYVARAFPAEGLIRVEEGRTSQGDAYRIVSYPSKSHCYLRNLLDLDDLVGGVDETIDVRIGRISCIFE